MNLYNEDGSLIDRTPTNPQEWAELVAETFIFGYWLWAVENDCDAGLAKMSLSARIDWLQSEMEVLVDRDDSAYLRLPLTVRNVIMTDESFRRLVTRCF